jgi:hypothetical protein
MDMDEHNGNSQSQVTHLPVGQMTGQQKKSQLMAKKLAAPPVD